MAFPPLLVGEVAELLARAYVLASSRGGLTTFKPDADVDHKDFIVDRRGGHRHGYVQVKCATRLRQKQVWCVARYLPDQVPTSARVFYPRFPRPWVDRTYEDVARSRERLQPACVPTQAR